MRFTRLLLPVVGLAAAMSLTFATGAAPAQADPPANLFEGSWSGTVSVAESGVFVREGTCHWTISGQGRITGTISITTPGFVSSGSVVGRVDADGKLVLVNYAPDDVPSNGHNGLPLEGTAVLDGDDEIVASANRRDVDNTHVVILTRD